MKDIDFFLKISIDFCNGFYYKCLLKCLFVYLCVKYFEFKFICYMKVNIL